MPLLDILMVERCFNKKHYCLYLFDHLVHSVFIYFSVSQVCFSLVFRCLISESDKRSDKNSSCDSAGGQKP